MAYTDIELNSRKALKAISFPWGPGAFDMSLMANQILQKERNQAGVLRVKLFYHKANKESTPTQDVLETLESEIFAK